MRLNHSDRIVKFPIPFSGLPISKVNNPILTQFSTFNVIYNSLPVTRQFLDLLKEATGFDCKVTFLGLSDAPLVSSYVFSTNTIIENFLECGVPSTKEEMNEIAEEIDSVLFPEDVDVLSAIRTSNYLGKPIIYRRGDEPIIVKQKFSGRTILFWHRDKPNFFDNSLTHLAGVVTLEISRKLSNPEVIRLVDFENGIWSATYSVPITSISMVKWVWDLEGTSLIGLSNWEEA